MTTKKDLVVPRVLVKNPAAETHGSPVKLVKAVADVNTACTGNVVFDAVPTCVASLKKLVVTTEPLGKNVALLASLDAQRSTALAEQPQMVVDVRTAWHSFVSDVQEAGQKNPALVKATTLPLRAAALRLAVDAVIPAPEGANVTTLKSGLPIFGWAAVHGAAGYSAQMCVAPPAGAEAAWALLHGKGLKRHLAALVPEQHYQLRVAALGGDGRASAWSATVDFQAPPKKA